MIRFTDRQWEAASSAWLKWWQGELDRPIVCAQLLDAHAPDGPAPKGPIMTQANCLDFSIPAEAIIERMDWELSQIEFIGDAFPRMSLVAFGPGIVAPFLGGSMDNSSGAVWFGPAAGYGKEAPPLEEIRPQFNPEHPVVLRILDLYRAGRAKWGESVLLEYPDLGGTLDILASLRGSEALLMDLCDQPDEVLRAVKEIAECWHKYHALFHDALPDMKGYSAWLGVLSDRPNYVTQCDFCYMISPPMFDSFAYATLREDWALLPHSVYHLDGVGELAHLPTILADPHLNAVQWVPGDGKPDETNWPEVYRAIAGAGKGIVLNSLFALPEVIGQIDRPSAIAISNNNLIAPERHNAAKALITQYGGSV